LLFVRLPPQHRLRQPAPRCFRSVPLLFFPPNTRQLKLGASVCYRFILTKYLQRLGAYLSLSEEQDLPLKSLAIQAHHPVAFQPTFCFISLQALGTWLLNAGREAAAPFLPAILGHAAAMLQVSFKPASILQPHCSNVSCNLDPH
jgi:hypothetical protein